MAYRLGWVLYWIGVILALAWVVGLMLLAGDEGLAKGFERKPLLDTLLFAVPTFALYGLDKALAKARGARVPETILNLLAIQGGFAGAWLGMAVFRHKTNYRKHPLIWTVLALSTIGHAVLIYLWLL